MSSPFYSQGQQQQPPSSSGSSFSNLPYTPDGSSHGHGQNLADADLVEDMECVSPQSQGLPMNRRAVKHASHACVPCQTSRKKCDGKGVVPCDRCRDYWERSIMVPCAYKGRDKRTKATPQYVNQLEVKLEGAQAMVATLMARLQAREAQLSQLMQQHERTAPLPELQVDIAVAPAADQAFASPGHSSGYSEQAFVHLAGIPDAYNPAIQDWVHAQSMQRTREDDEQSASSYNPSPASAGSPALYGADLCDLRQGMGELGLSTDGGSLPSSPALASSLRLPTSAAPSSDATAQQYNYFLSSNNPSSSSVDPRSPSDPSMLWAKWIPHHPHHHPFVSNRVLSAAREYGPAASFGYGPPSAVMALQRGSATVDNGAMLINGRFYAPSSGNALRPRSRSAAAAIGVFNMQPALGPQLVHGPTQHFDPATPSVENQQHHMASTTTPGGFAGGAGHIQASWANQSYPPPPMDSLAEAHMVFNAIPSMPDMSAATAPNGAAWDGAPQFGAVEDVGMPEPPILTFTTADSPPFGQR